MKISKFAPLLIVTILFLSACTLDPPIFPKTTSSSRTTTTTKSGYYLKGTLNNQAVDWEVTDNITGWLSGSNSEMTTDSQGDISGGLSAAIVASAGLEPEIQIEFHTFQVAAGGDKSAYFHSFITTGPWIFAASSNIPVTPQTLVIDYIDDAGKAYTSEGMQTGNSANIVSVTPIAATGSSAESLKIKLTFNCNLYPIDGSSGTITLTNAEATVKLEDRL